LVVDFVGLLFLIIKLYKLRNKLSAALIFASSFLAAVGLLRSFYCLGYCFGLAVLLKAEFLLGIWLLIC